MAGSGAFAANGADRYLLNVNNQADSIAITFNAIQDQNVRTGQKRLRMAWGRCHRSPTLKHLRSDLF
jgi:hypothetical protein